MFAAFGIVPLAMWALARDRLTFVRSLVASQPWPVIRAYTAGTRGYLVMVIADREVTLSYSRERGHASISVHVALPPPGLPRFEIQPAGVVELVVPGAPLRLGDAVDAGFDVRSSDPDDTRALWTPARCDRLRAEYARGSVRCDGRELILTFGVVRTIYGSGRTESIGPREAVAAITFALELATADLYGLGAACAAFGATPQIDASGVHVELDGPSPIRVRPVRRDGQVVTTVTLEEGALPDPAFDLAALGLATLAAEGSGVTIRWSHVETDRARLIAAVELLRMLGGAPHEGAYR
jgi:hypothetical protein